MIKLTKVQIKTKADVILKKDLGKINKAEVVEDKKTKLQQVRVQLVNGRKLTVDITGDKWEETLEKQVNKFKNK